MIVFILQISVLNRPRPWNHYEEGRLSQVFCRSDIHINYGEVKYESKGSALTLIQEFTIGTIY